MPLDRLLAIHQIEVLKATYTKSATMVAQRSDEVDRKIDCHVVPMGVIERAKFARDGLQVSHRILTAEDPGLEVDNRVRFRGTIMRIVTPSDYSAQERIYYFLAIASSEDNQAQATMA